MGYTQVPRVVALAGWAVIIMYDISNIEGFT